MGSPLGWQQRLLFKMDKLRIRYVNTPYGMSLLRTTCLTCYKRASLPCQTHAKPSAPKPTSPIHRAVSPNVRLHHKTRPSPLCPCTFLPSSVHRLLSFRPRLSSSSPVQRSRSYPFRPCSNARTQTRAQQLFENLRNLSPIGRPASHELPYENVPSSTEHVTSSQRFHD
jgi:hypothetical protein